MFEIMPRKRQDNGHTNGRSLRLRLRAFVEASWKEIQACLELVVELRTDAFVVKY